MKVVLREEVEHLGRRGEVVNVARGYARNFLLPKGLAWEATPGNLKTLALRRRAWEDQELKEKTGGRIGISIPDRDCRGAAAFRVPSLPGGRGHTRRRSGTRCRQHPRLERP